MERSRAEKATNVFQSQNNDTGVAKTNPELTRNSDRMQVDEEDSHEALTEKLRRLQSDNAELGIALVHHAEAARIASSGAAGVTKLQLRRRVYDRLLQNQDFTKKLDKLGNIRQNPRNQEAEEDSEGDGEEVGDVDLYEEDKIRKCRGIIKRMGKRFPFFMHSNLTVDLATILANIRSGSYLSAQEIRQDIGEIKNVAIARFGRDTSAEKDAKALEGAFRIEWTDRILHDDDSSYEPEDVSGNSGRGSPD